MDKKDGLEEEHRESEEEYSFLQEVIKDETGGRKLRSGILHMIALGFVFGIVACFSFSVSKPWIEEKLGGDPKQVTIPKDELEEEGKEEEQDENAETGPVQEETQENSAPDAESYRQMLQSLRDIARVSGKCVVEITGLTGEEEEAQEPGASKDSISGIIVADNGQELLILGKRCPVKDVKSILVTFAGGDGYEAVVKAYDANLGLAVYAVPRDVISDETWTKIDEAVLGNSNLVNTGDTVIVLGKPFGYANAYNYGLISSDAMNINLSDGQYELIYTDVSGSGSGSGVIVNVRGEVIGIVDQTLLEEDSRNLIAGYSISDIKEIIELLSNGGSVPYIGIYGVDVSEDMKEQGLPQGVYVKEVEADSPAMTAGIQNGDIITSVDGGEIIDVMGYHNILMGKDLGNRVVLKGSRQGTGGEYVDIDFTVTIGSKQ
ncbi:MAG: S1C family serine protease [Lachnospiraceae bacterium]